MQNNDKYFDDYKAFMSTILDNGYAVPCKSEPVEGKVWYSPHHGIYHPRKPNKIRVVFDCSAKYKNVSLNGILLQGPDLTNQLVGVLSRFRKEQVAFFGDIEKMFYRVKVPEEQQDFLRFVWWEDGDLDKEIKDYRMTVHLFGAVSSPSCANYALRKTADDNVGKYDTEVTSILKDGFYVGDLLESALNEVRAGKLLWETKAICNDGGFNLTQLGSTSREVIDTIPEKDRMKGIKTLDSSTSTLPVERVLGVSWCIQNDEFNFRIILKDKPLTRRGILSSVSSIYDPLGFAAPVMLLIKRLLQKLIKDEKGWDEEISSEDRAVWEKWRSNLPSLETVSIRRCFKPKNFGKVVNATAHHFSDGSSIGYGQCSYLQLMDDHNQISVSFLMGKSRVAPLKQITIPRMELTAAVTSIKVSNLLHEELMCVPDLEHIFWTDSQVVLGYISNETKSFHTYVSNRIQAIRNESDISQWNYVPTKANTSDIGSRGIKASKLAESGWLQGPEFLKEPFKKPSSEVFEVSPDDPEVKRKKKILVIKSDKKEVEFINHLLVRTNNWLKLRRIVAWILKWATKSLRRPVVRNPQASSHMGGAWERLIRSARLIFSSLLENHGLSLNNEAFLTLLTEIEAIINSRPLTVDTLSDGVSELPLSPINLLTMKSRVVLPPPGNYSQNDLYSRKRWRRVQHIANEFWDRWKKEYLQTFQQRTKWKQKARNFTIGDVVLLKETNFRNDWKFARVVDVNKDDTNTVRSCKVKTSIGIFTRPIHKLVLLMESEDETTAEQNASGDD